MAATTTMTEWAEELARSFIATKSPTSKTRKAVEHFTRSIRHHNYARTNQFEVQERLVGLEEKFLVLNYDDLSDALRDRRMLLNRRQERWLPDALDLLLNLSRDPLKQDGLEAVSRLGRSIPAIPTMKWSEFETDEPINRKDTLWTQPDFGDISSDEDEAVISSVATSPASQKHEQPPQAGVDDAIVPGNVVAAKLAPNLVEDLRSHILSRRHEDVVTITEVQAIRETLFMVQGFSTTLFFDGDSSILVNPRFVLAHLDAPSMHTVLQSAIEISIICRRVRDWVSKRPALQMMQVLQDCIRESLLSFDRTIAQLHNSFLPGSSGVASLLRVVDSVKHHAIPLNAVDHYLWRIRNKDAISCLDILHDEICILGVCGDSKTFQTLLLFFRAMLKSYAGPLDEWISRGALSEHDYFFIQRDSDQQTKSTFWHTWYICSKDGPSRPPKFLEGLAERVFSAGKTQAFLNQLGTAPSNMGTSFSLPHLIDAFCDSSDTSLSPFAPTLFAHLEQYVSSHLATSTSTLQTNLQHRLGLGATLSAFSHLYLCASGAITDNIDTVLFSHIDRCNSSWNDRYLVSDQIEETFGDAIAVECDRITIESQPMSPADIKSARQSVQLLSNLSISYILPWPIANILLPTATLASYQRIALFLSQIRRAKYALGRHALPALQSKTNFSHSVSVRQGKLLRPVREAEGVYLSLHTFIATIYAHLTTCVVGPMTERFQQAVTSNGDDSGDSGGAMTVDEMITLHLAYLREMEVACFTAPEARNLRVLRDTAIEVLDLCLKFSFDLSASNARGKGFDVDELAKTKRQTRKSVQLLITGLRGVARNPNTSTEGSNEANEMLGLLADRLESCGFTR